MIIRRGQGGVNKKIIKILKVEFGVFLGLFNRGWRGLTLILTTNTYGTGTHEFHECFRQDDRMFF
jgi:hypothetical protein